ncbi:hypothetical protein OG874_19485 [Nocardia sp. NBC_00565]|nr:hypothetical protein [Nocardia sp. NBC_00565]WUC07141.1 hypothetical protein OG874_19485 [Nocardia sp. NBC_00565]
MVEDSTTDHTADIAAIEQIVTNVDRGPAEHVGPEGSVNDRRRRSSIH